MYRKESGWYPAGAEFDPRAPWNQVEPEERKFDTFVTISMSKSSEVYTTEYTEDEDGDIDLLETPWTTEWSHEHLNPQELMKELVILASEKLATSEDSEVKRKMRKIINDAEGWEVDEFLVEPE